MSESHLELARYNVNSLYRAGDELVRRGYWSGSRRVEELIANSIHAVFHRFAWADARLSDDECAIYDLVLAIDAKRGGYLPARGLASDEAAVEELISIASLCDSQRGTSLVDAVIDHLKNLALSVVMSDRRVLESEFAIYETYFVELRDRINAAL